MFKISFITLILFASFPLLCRAQVSKNIDIQLNLGTSVPLEASHFEKYWNPGVHFGGGLEFSINDMFVLKWDAAFNSFIFKHKEWKSDLINLISVSGEETPDFVVNGGNRYILETSIGAKFFPIKNEHFNPFLTLGVGMVNMSTDDLIVGYSGPDFTVETVPYFTVGLGTEVSYWEGFSLFGQIVYKFAQTKDENDLNFPIDFKDTFKEQETGLIAVEFGIIFDLAK